MPLFLHELQHAIATAPAGARPKPLSDSSAEMRAVPVILELEYAGGVVAVPVDGFQLRQFQFQGCRASALVLRAALPDGYGVVTAVAPEPEPVVKGPLEPFPVDWTQRTDGIIPELETVDPAVFRTNTDRPAGTTASGNGTGERVPNAGDAKEGN